MLATGDYYVCFCDGKMFEASKKSNDFVILTNLKSTISFWENGVNEPKASYIVAVAKVFSVSSDYLLGLKDTMRPTGLTGLPYPSQHLVSS